jgi:hypothetical protein
MKEFKVTFTDDFEVEVSNLEGTMADNMQNDFADVLMHYFALNIKSEIVKTFDRLNKCKSVDNELTKIAFETILLHKELYGETEESKEVEKNINEISKEVSNE